MDGTARTPHWFYILLALADADLHGSGIRREVLDTTGGEVRLWPVKLYSTLDELVAAGWIEALADDEHPGGKSKRRRYYRITNDGRDALAAETERLGNLVRVARRRIRAQQRGAS